MIKDLSKMLNARIAAHRIGLAGMESDGRLLEDMSSQKDLTFKVELTALWDEQANVEMQQNGVTVKALIKSAEQEFLRANNCSDVQAKYSVRVILPNKTILDVPEKFWKKK